MTEQQTLRSTVPHDPGRATLRPVWGQCWPGSLDLCSQCSPAPIILNSCFSRSAGSAQTRGCPRAHSYLVYVRLMKSNITRALPLQSLDPPFDKRYLRKIIPKGRHLPHIVSRSKTYQLASPSTANMQGKMSLHTLLNPDEIDSGASVSARSTPDPATPASAASQPESWTPATRWSSSHRRNESLQSTASSSRDQVSSQEIRFPPFNDLDVVSRQLAMEFNVDPLGAIWPRQRPVSYNSDKRELKARTGLNKFHGRLKILY
jgi:hypothetical protein